MTKLRIQAQYLQPGDVVGSGEKVTGIVLNSICWPSNKCLVEFQKDDKLRQAYWGKHTMINVERADAPTPSLS